MKKLVPQTLFAALILLVSVVTAGAQAKSAKASAKSAPAQPKVEQLSDLQKFRQDFIKAAEDYRASLQELSASYEGSHKRAVEQHEKLKDLYKDGLISRLEYESSAKQVADAAAQVEDTRREIAKAEETLAVARKPIEPIAAPEVFVARADVAWTTGNRAIDNLIRLNGKRYGVDPYLVFCVMHQESRFGVGATSHKGASGLMQLMPGTAARYGVTNIYDPAQNIQGGTRYLADLLRLFRGRVDLALAGYNAGEGAVMKYGNRIPPYRETQNYVRVIGTRYAQSGGGGLTHTVKTSAPTKRK